VKCDIEHLEARIFHGLKSLLVEKDTLPPRYLEYVLCEAFGLRHVGDSNDYADGVDSTCQASVKTRMLSPEIKKSTVKDFATHPDKFMGVSQNKKQGWRWPGLEFVQRRQEIPNEETVSADYIGKKSVWGFMKKIVKSKRKFKVKKTYEILLVHGYNWKYNRYMVNVYWEELSFPKFNSITWQRTRDGVNGCIDIDGLPHIVMHRVRGGLKRQGTCFKEFKNPTKYKHSVNISVPIPERWPFDKTTVLAELMHLKEIQNGPILFE
jgi:hypothetical protein